MFLHSFRIHRPNRVSFYRRNKNSRPKKAALDRCFSQILYYAQGVITGGFCGWLIGGFLVEGATLAGRSLGLGEFRCLDLAFVFFDFIYLSLLFKLAVDLGLVP